MQNLIYTTRVPSNPFASKFQIEIIAVFFLTHKVEKSYVVLFVIPPIIEVKFKNLKFSIRGGFLYRRGIFFN